MLPDVGMVTTASKCLEAWECWPGCNVCKVSWRRWIVTCRGCGLPDWQGTPPCIWTFVASVVCWCMYSIFNDSLHHPYICGCFCRKPFYSPLYIQNKNIPTSGCMRRLATYIHTLSFELVANCLRNRYSSSPPHFLGLNKLRTLQMSKEHLIEGGGHN